MPGRPLEEFSVESLAVEGSKITALGCLCFEDVMEDKFSPKRHVSIAWQAENLSISGQLSGWKVWQQLGKAPAVSSRVVTALQGLVSTELQAYITNHPESIAHVTRHEAEKLTGPKLLQGEPTPAALNFPPDWMGRFGHPLVPAHRERNRVRGPKKSRAAHSVIIRLPVRTIAGGGYRLNGKPVKLYDGLREPYQGPCVCWELEESGPRRRFDWDLRTMKAFPERCFECSCGVHWWCNRPLEGFWVRVADNQAWESLCNYNGVPVGSFAYEGDVLYLVETLVAWRSGLPYYLHVES
jgi:hypothetical protein